MIIAKSARCIGTKTNLGFHQLPYGELNQTQLKESEPIVYYAKNPAVVTKLQPIARLLGKSSSEDIGRLVATKRTTPSISPE